MSISIQMKCKLESIAPKTTNNLTTEVPCWQSLKCASAPSQCLTLDYHLSFVLAQVH